VAHGSVSCDTSSSILLLTPQIRLHHTQCWIDHPHGLWVPKKEQNFTKRRNVNTIGDDSRHGHTDFLCLERIDHSSRTSELGRVVHRNILSDSQQSKNRLDIVLRRACNGDTYRLLHASMDLPGLADRERDRLNIGDQKDFKTNTPCLNKVGIFYKDNLHTFLLE